VRFGEYKYTQADRSGEIGDDPEGVIMQPMSSSQTTDAPQQGEGSGRRRLPALLVAVTFAAAAVATGIVSVGAYCLTTDGGNLLRLRPSGPPDAGRSPEPGTASAGAYCPLPPASLRGDDEADAAVSAGEHTREAAWSGPPIDRLPHPEMETATFGLG